MAKAQNDQPEPAYRVASNTTIVTLRGPVRAGGYLRPRDFVEGQAKLDELVEQGAVVKWFDP